MEERSAGAIVFHDGTEGRRYLLLRYPAGHWDFPKGNIERGEQINETVAREIFEETGLRNILKVGDFKKRIEYFYHRGGKKVHKEVTFFLIKSTEDGVKISHEHQDFGWFKLGDAMKMVTYSNSKRALAEAAKFLETMATGLGPRA